MNKPSYARHVLTMNQLKTPSVSNNDLITSMFALRARACLEAFVSLNFLVNTRNYFIKHVIYNWFRIFCRYCPFLTDRPLAHVLSGSAGMLSSAVPWKWNLLQLTSMFWPLNSKNRQPSDPSKPTFIFVLNALKISGGVFETYRLASELRDSGEDVLMVVMWRSPNEMDNAQQIPIMRLTDWKTRVAWAAFQLPIIAILFWRESRRLKTIETRPIWIFTHYSTLPLAMLVPKWCRWSFVQDLEWRFLGEGVSAQLLKKFIMAVYRRSHLLAANTGLETALQRCDLKVDAVAPIWADKIFMQTGNEKRDIDILMVLRKGAHKRLDLYLAFISQFAHASNIRMVVITTEDEIAEQVRPLVSECHVRVNNIAMTALYARTKVFLHLSEHEGFGLPPLEAMGSGCVPVCRDSGGPQSYMRGALRDLLLPLTLPLADVYKTVFTLLNDSVEFQRYSETSRHLFHEGVAISDKRASKIINLMSKQ